MIAEPSVKSERWQKCRDFQANRHRDLTGAGHLLPQKLRIESGPWRTLGRGMAPEWI
jgi:hypothetical protein